MADFNSEFFIDYSKLDDYQRQLINRKTGRSMVVMGSAGSGKSLIALHKAKQIADMRESYSIVVYTKSLKKYFQDGLSELGLQNVYNFNQWQSYKKHVRYLIVDECQDFTREQINEMKDSADYCLFFGDSSQSIMNFGPNPTQSVERTAADIGIPPERLYFNYRLTKQVATLCEKIGNVEDLVLSCKREGEKPNLIKTNSYEAQLDRIVEIIRNRSLNNVGILLPHNTIESGGRAGKEKLSVEYVKNYLNGKGLNCEFKYNANKDTEMDLDFHSSNPKIMTWWCAKGLQFKDVFIPGCETSTDKTAALYVAMTRCSERLYLCYTNNLAPIFPNESNSVYNNSNNVEMI